jgi:hypothetical protein
LRTAAEGKKLGRILDPNAGPLASDLKIVTKNEQALAIAEGVLKVG